MRHEALLSRKEREYQIISSPPLKSYLQIKDIVRYNNEQQRCLDKIASSPEVNSEKRSILHILNTPSKLETIRMVKSKSSTGTPGVKPNFMQSIKFMENKSKCNTAKPK